MHLYVLGVTRPSSGGSVQMLFGVIACVASVQSLLKMGE
jgi:hypothetical protein